MDYLKTVVPSNLLSERGSNLVVINPGSANLRIGLASQDTPVSVPHCVARHTTQPNKFFAKDQLLNSQVTTAQHMEREKAYDIIASLLKIPFLDEEVGNNAYPRKVGRADGSSSHQNSKKDTPFQWTNVYERDANSSDSLVDDAINPENGEINEKLESADVKELSSSKKKYRKTIFGEEALRISSSEPYCLHRPIRRGHLNISQHYPAQQVLDDLHALWDWVLNEQLNIPVSQRSAYAAVLVLPDTFDYREIREMLNLVLRDLCFGTAVVHQEGLAAVFGNGLSTACVVNLGAQVTSIICVEDGVVLPNTEKMLPFGGEDISRCLLWTQRHHQTWPQIRSDVLTKPIDLLMLNKLRESYCEIKEGEVDAVCVVHSYDDGKPPGPHKTRLTALNVPPMGLFYPTLLVPDVCALPHRFWFHDYEDSLDDTYHGSDGMYSLWENYPVYHSKPKEEEIVGISEAITSSILSSGRIDLQRKLFCGIQLIGGVALTPGLVSAVEDSVLHSIPANEAIDTVEVLNSRTNPCLVTWKGGAILGILEMGRDIWMRREDWMNNGVNVGGSRKYKDSYYLQAQALCYLGV